MPYGKILVDQIESSGGKVLNSGQVTSELEAIAHSLNKPVTKFVYSTDTVKPIGDGDGVDYVYNASEQTTWVIPAGVGNGEKITDVTGSDLTTSGGTYTLLPILSQSNIIDAEDLEIYGDDNDNPTENCAELINKWLPTVGIRLRAGVTYTYTEKLVIPTGAIFISESPQNPAMMQYVNNKSTGRLLETEGAGDHTGGPHVAVDNITVENITFTGNRDDFTIEEIDALGNDEGTGGVFVCNNSRIYNVLFTRTAGVGYVFTNYSTSTTPAVNGNVIKIFATRNGQEGGIIESGLDNKIHQAHSYLAWDSDRDTDYTKTKQSKWNSGACSVATIICAGLLIRGVSQEFVEENHPSNNYFGYAAAFVAKNIFCRLRGARFIGESSAGGLYFDEEGDVSLDSMECHSTKGKYGLALFYSKNVHSLVCPSLHVLVDSPDPALYPTNGTYEALHIDGANHTVETTIINNGGTCYNKVVSINGTNQSVKGRLLGYNGGFKQNSDSIDVANIYTRGFLSESNIEFDIDDCNLGWESQAGALIESNAFNFKFTRSATAIESSTKALLTNELLRNWSIVDTENSINTKTKSITADLGNSLPIGSWQTGSINYDGFFITPKVRVSAHAAAGINPIVHFNSIDSTTVNYSYKIETTGTNLYIDLDLFHG